MEIQMKIHIEYGVSKKTLGKIKQEIEETIKLEPDLWGCNYKIIMDDFTFIDGENYNQSYTCVGLCRNIMEIISAAQAA